MSSSNELGWDIAVSYAKRAVCRRIDGFLANNWLNLRRPSALQVGQGASRGAQWTGIMSASPY